MLSDHQAKWRGFFLKRHQFQRVNIGFETGPGSCRKVVWCVHGCLCVQERLAQGPAASGCLAYRALLDPGPRPSPDLGPLLGLAAARRV